MQSKMNVNSRSTCILALALMGLFPGAGPTWHSYTASSSRVALVRRRLYTPLESSPATE